MAENKYLTAEVAQVQIGNRIIEGLMFEGGNFGVGVPQIAALFPYFQDDHNQAAKKLKRLMGKGFKTTKAKALNQRNYILTIELEQFPSIIKALFRKLDPIADELIDELLGLSLHQLWADAFSIKFEKEERQKWLKERQTTKETFWFLTDSIKEYYEMFPKEEKYPNQHYCEVFDTLNLCLFDKRSKVIKTELGIKKGSLNRDHFGKQSLERIKEIQKVAKNQIANGNHPVEAVKFAVSVFGYDPISYAD